MKEFNTDIVCEKCRVPYIPVGVDTDNTYYGPSCECWLDDIPKETENSGTQKAIETDYVPYQNELNVNFEKYFSDLKAKYLIGYIPQNCSSAQLYQILFRLEHGPDFNDEEIELLKNRSLFPIIANIYFQRYYRTANGWNLAQACSNYRIAGFPRIGIQITNQFPTNDRKLMAAICTTRGGAFKDLKDLSNAEYCAKTALLHNRTKYPLTLLGAIYYLYGRPTEGDKYFDAARKFGMSMAEYDKTISTEIKKAEVAEKKIIAKHLVQKDPDRYSWAEMYIER